MLVYQRVDSIDSIDSSLPQLSDPALAAKSRLSGGSDASGPQWKTSVAPWRFFACRAMVNH